MQLNSFNLVKVNRNNRDHLQFLKDMVKDNQMQYLWDLSLETYKNGNEYIAMINNNNVGYLYVSNPTDGKCGVSISLYYGILQGYQGNGYATNLLIEFKNYIFSNTDIRMIVCEVEKENQKSIKVLQKSNFTNIYSDDEWEIYADKKYRTK